MVPSLEGPEGFLGLRGPRGPVPGPLPPWWGSCLSRAPGEGAPELQGEQKGIMVARMRARQSATSLLGAQARAGVRPEVERQRDRKKEREKRERRGEGRGGRREQKQKGEGRKGGRERDVDVEEAGKAKQRREQRTKEGRSSIPLVFSQLTQYANTGGAQSTGTTTAATVTAQHIHSITTNNDTWKADKQPGHSLNQGSHLHDFLIIKADFKNRLQSGSMTWMFYLVLVGSEDV